MPSLVARGPMLDVASARGGDPDRDLFWRVEEGRASFSHCYVGLLTILRSS